MTDTPPEETPLEGLAAVEAEFGFTFGGEHDTDDAPATLSVLCTNLTCKQRGKHIQLHADTALPVTCGGCGAPLYCEHPDTKLTIHHEGTLKAPVKVIRNVCTLCGEQMSRTDQRLKPIAVDEIPLHLLAGADLNSILGSN